MSSLPLHEQFAAADDMIRHGGPADFAASSPVAAAIDLAQRLRAEAKDGIPDPEFIAGLREQLRLRAGAVQQAGTAELRFSTIETPLGLLAIAYRDGRVAYCARLGESGESGFERSVAQQLGILPQREAVPPPDLLRAVKDHLAGRQRFRAVDLSGLTPFQQRVLNKTSEIPRGQVRPYGWVAREIGAPGATRAVGTALGHNPIPYLIPCHRVVRTDGSLGEYSGGGPAMKERVLAFEGVAVAHHRSGLRVQVGPAWLEEQS
jgi:methylated-DNA-[protein]-cysteine S-methyltransferase